LNLCFFVEVPGFYFPVPDRDFIKFQRGFFHFQKSFGIKPYSLAKGSTPHTITVQQYLRQGFREQNQDMKK
tara:strand:- start:319 stop:531 length:213 start_codon:yes stop_codon:yes gene_type:complete